MNRSFVMSPMIVVDNSRSVKLVAFNARSPGRRPSHGRRPRRRRGSRCDGGAEGYGRSRRPSSSTLPSTSRWSPVSTTRSISQSTKATAPASTGFPDGAGCHSTPSNLSVSLTAKRDEISAWSWPSTLTQNDPEVLMGGQLFEVVATKNPTSGGSSETGTKVPTDSPFGRPSTTPATTATLVGTCAITWRKRSALRSGTVARRRRRCGSRGCRPRPGRGRSPRGEPDDPLRAPSRPCPRRKSGRRPCS